MVDPAEISHYHKTRAWMFVVLYAALIFFLSHQPGNPNLVLPFPHFDKFVHFFEYLVFAIFLQRALFYSGIRRMIWTTLAVAVLYGVTDEIHQSFVPYRSADWRDLIADAIGASAGIVLFQALLPARYRDTWSGKPLASPTSRTE